MPFNIVAILLLFIGILLCGTGMVLADRPLGKLFMVAGIMITIVGLLFL